VVLTDKVAVAALVAALVNMLVVIMVALEFLAKVMLALAAMVIMVAVEERELLE
jgi:hypothetical protein